MIAAASVLSLGVGLRYLIDSGFAEARPEALDHALRASMVIILALAVSTVLIGAPPEKLDRAKIPYAALIGDLKARGLLDETLLIWAGEFGRTPFAQGSNGRDHNPFGFTVWMAGGGIQGGVSYGETDDWGYKAVQDRIEIHDLHATMLHMLGIEHERSTFRFGGRDVRLTDVHGHVIREILA